MKKKKKSRGNTGGHVNKYDGYSQVETVRRNADKTNKLISDNGESNLSAIKKDLEPVSRYNKPNKEIQEAIGFAVMESTLQGEAVFSTQDDHGGNNQLNETVETIQPEVEESTKEEHTELSKKELKRLRKEEKRKLKEMQDDFLNN